MFSQYLQGTKTIQTGQFEDCTKEVLPGVETESSSDEEDQNITDHYQQLAKGCYITLINKNT